MTRRSKSKLKVKKKVKVLILLAITILIAIIGALFIRNKHFEYVTTFNQRYNEIKELSLQIYEQDTTLNLSDEVIEKVKKFDKDLASGTIGYSEIKSIEEKTNYFTSYKDKVQKQIDTELDQIDTALNSEYKFTNSQMNQLEEIEENYNEILNKTYETLNEKLQEYLELLNVHKQLTLLKAEIDASIDANENSDDTCQETYIEGILLVNKTHCISSTYNPGGITQETQVAWDKMEQAAKDAGITITIGSSFRTYEYQVQTYNHWVDVYGQEGADAISARPGYSEHQTGMAIDVQGVNGCYLEECFAETPEGIWLESNAHKYGFIIRYPKGKEAITGYDYEPWHIRYVGVNAATKIYNQGLCLEEYLGV